MTGMIELYREDFTDTDEVVVNHELDLDYVGGVRLIVGSIARNDLIDGVFVPKDDPLNSFTVKLGQICSGSIQVIGTDYVRIGQASSRQAVSLAFGEGNTNSAQSQGSQTTSNPSWVEKLTMTKTLEEGTYRIGFSYVWTASSSSNSRRFNARLMIDDEEAYLHRQRIRQEDDEIPASFFIYKALEAGEHTISLQFRREGGVMTVGMKNANLEIWRTNDG